MTYRVCIPCAGTGTRLGGLTKYLNKSLVSIANKPTLSHLIENFPDDAEFVIALGYKGHLIREFLQLSYPTRKFLFAEVSPFEGGGSGLGLSLQFCEEYLQQPFVFISCDTLVEEQIPPPDKNWMGCSDVANLDCYRTVAIHQNVVTGIAEKGVGRKPEHKAYIGLAGIHDYKRFWYAMRQGGQISIETGETYGLANLLETNIEAKHFSWHDTGNPIALAQARERYREADSPNILEKANEAIWFVNDQVIKFSDDERFIENRTKRAQYLEGFVPEVTGATKHMYRYPKIQAAVLSDVITLNLFEALLEHSQRFWLRTPMSPCDAASFQQNCLSFYRDKTLERVALFYSNFSLQDNDLPINGKAMPYLSELLGSLDWDWLSDGLPGRFHGDFHFENILWSCSDHRFVFLDWRQDFAGSLNTGDIYYDLAKLLHGLIISHELVAGNFFKVNWRAGDISYDFHRKQILVECERYFGAWLDTHGYDKKKVFVLTALIYLNIAALHHHPYSVLLYSLGKSMLKSELEN